MPRLEFSHVHSYASPRDEISLPVVLKSGGASLDLLAFVDTGSSHCLFQRSCCEVLGLDLESGEPKTFRTANGRVETFGHVVQIEMSHLTIESMVYFFVDAGIQKNLLGRVGWLDRIRLGLIGSRPAALSGAVWFRGRVSATSS